MVGSFFSLHRVLTFLALLGLLAGLFMITLDQKTIAVAQPITAPSVPPFESFISGAGIIEAASENIGLGAMVTGVVEHIFVKKGEMVRRGDILFTLNGEQAKADVEVKKCAVEQAQSSVGEARAKLQLAQDEFDLVDHLVDKRGVSKEEIIVRRNNLLIAQSALKSAEAGLKTAYAQLEEALVFLSFYTVRAPIDGQILQINIHPGGSAPMNQLLNSPSVETVNPLMLIGDILRHHVRVDIDENDGWRFEKGERAVAFLRGNIQFQTELQFEYLEPYIVPKQSFTGDSTERVDTRVLQVVYSYDPKALPAYLGQEVDVYIKAKPIHSTVRYGGPLSVSR